MKPAMAKKRDAKIKARCVGCRATKIIDREESARLSASMSVPMCDNCFMPMVAEQVRP